MSTYAAQHTESEDASSPQELPRHVARMRAVLALAWAAAIIIAVGSHEPATAADLAIGVAALLATYPLIDVGSSVINARAHATARRVLLINAAISAAAVVALAVASFGSDAGATMKTFGAWAAISGAIQFGVAVHRRRANGGEAPMIVSGGLSTIAGISFIAQSSGHHAHLINIGGYMALGALLYLLTSFRERTRTHRVR